MNNENKAALYNCPNLPASWVVRLDGALWIVPAIANGWNARTEYKGHPPEAAGFDLVPLNRAMGCGIPWPEYKGRIVCKPGRLAASAEQMAEDMGLNFETVPNVAETILPTSWRWVAVAADLEGPAWGMGYTPEDALENSREWRPETMTEADLVAVQITPESFQRVKDGNPDAWEQIEESLDL